MKNQTEFNKRVRAALGSDWVVWWSKFHGIAPESVYMAVGRGAPARYYNLLTLIENLKKIGVDVKKL